MATQIVQSPERPHPQAVRMNFRKAGSRFFAPAMELLEFFFGSPKRLDYLDAQLRATLPTEYGRPLVPKNGRGAGSFPRVCRADHRYPY